jgi:hypothetical protein
MIRRTLWSALAVAALASGLGAGCSHGTEPSRRKDLVDRSLMACLGAIRAHHRQADVHLQRSDVPAAIAAMEQALALPCRDRPSAEIRESLLDVYGRLARLHLQRGELDRARARVEEGLRRPGGDSFFRANLHLVQGDVLDAQAERRSAEKDAPGADALRRQAIQAFGQSAAMNQRLLQELIP